MLLAQISIQGVGVHSSCFYAGLGSRGDGKEAVGSGGERVRKENKLGSEMVEDA